MPLSAAASFERSDGVSDVEPQVCSLGVPSAFQAGTSSALDCHVSRHLNRSHTKNIQNKLAGDIEMGPSHNEWEISVSREILSVFSTAQKLPESYSNASRATSSAEIEICHLHPGNYTYS